MQKLRRFLTVKETSPVANRLVVPLEAKTKSNEDIIETPVIDVGIQPKDLQGSPSSSTAHIDAKVGRRPPSPPSMMSGLHVDAKAAPQTPYCLPHTRSPSTSSISAVAKRSRSTHTLPSDKKGERIATKSATSIEKPASGRESVASKRSNSVTARPRANTTWASDDSFLPRAKPPPPIITKHNRDASKTIPPSTPTKRRRPSTSHQKSSNRTLSKPPPLDLPPGRSALDIQKPSTARSNSMKATSSRPRSIAHRQSNSHSNVTIPGAPPVPKQVNRKVSLPSMGSAHSDKSLAPEKFTSAWAWTPPASWAGPSGDVVVDDVSVDQDGDKKIGRSKLVRSNNPKGSLNRHVHARPNTPVQNIWRPQQFRLTEIGTPEAASVSEEGAELPLPDVIVKVQSAENDQWHESALADVIPHLRALKSK